MNGEPIPMAELERALEQRPPGQRAEPDAAERRRVLERIIEEELLVQRGIEIGLLRSDRAVRAALVAAMLDSIVAEASSRPLGEAELRRFHARHAAYFARPGRLRVEQIFFRSGPDALERAERAWARLEAGEDFAALSKTLGDPDRSGLPDALLPPGKLRDYLGPTLTSAATALAEGAHSRPLAGPTGVHLLRLAEVEVERAPPFEEIRAQVEAELRRRAGERDLRDYLKELREAAEIELTEPPRGLAAGFAPEAVSPPQDPR